MRGIGALAVLLACLGFGGSAARADTLALRCIEDLCRGVRGMREALAVRLEPLEGLLRGAAARTEGEAEGFFLAAAASLGFLGERGFHELWREACRGFLPHLPETLRRELEDLGGTLGRASLSDQLTACDRFLHLAGTELEARRLRLPGQRRLALALGGAAGLFLCLLIL